MKLFCLEQSQMIPISLDEAWAFFSDPRNLAKITPPDLNLIPSSAVPDHMYAGLVITYRVKIVPQIYTTWVTEITQVEAPNFFVDEQRFGPYKFWHHQHRFTECPEGVLAGDVIHYGLYGGPFANVVNWMVVKRQLDGVFGYRKQVLEDLFGT
ncbi:MAG: SRPBCC family protein [Candidatus Latescibacteria bacterium]|jgi:ligand-binding SRPBCC domain-containing protein|nr:SRPBCC family protein [Candidatus Latescibacterota bacterium]MBT4136764.1 SRPBCC family protein [Candidatus Latescibacterota bacterium]MBT5828703.1 SRPBCC family protein [Candidatus Latescibacterota bacterium]